MVEQATWVTLIHKEVQCAQTRFDKLQILANNAKRNMSRSKTGLNQDIMSGAKDLKKDSDYSGLRSNLQSSRIKTKGMMSCKERV